MSAISARVRGFIGELLARKGEPSQVADDELLITSGRLDSVDVLEIVTFLESNYAMDFAARPFDPADFDTVARIAALISESR